MVNHNVAHVKFQDQNSLLCTPVAVVPTLRQEPRSPISERIMKNHIVGGVWRSRTASDVSSVPCVCEVRSEDVFIDRCNRIVPIDIALAKKDEYMVASILGDMTGVKNRSAQTLALEGIWLGFLERLYEKKFHKDADASCVNSTTEPCLPLSLRELLKGTYSDIQTLQKAGFVLTNGDSLVEIQRVEKSAPYKQKVSQKTELVLISQVLNILHGEHALLGLKLETFWSSEGITIQELVHYADTYHVPVSISNVFTHLQNLQLSYFAEIQYLSLRKEVILNSEGLDDHLPPVLFNPLTYAVFSGATSLVRVLLLAGIDPSRFDEEGYTPLEYAYDSKNEEIFDLLVRQGANLSQCDREGYTLMTRAAENGDYNFIVALIEEYGVSPWNKDREGRSALTCAQEKGHTCICDYLKDPSLFHGQKRTRWSCATPWTMRKGTHRVANMALRTHVRPRSSFNSGFVWMKEKTTILPVLIRMGRLIGTGAFKKVFSSEIIGRSDCLDPPSLILDRTGQKHAISVYFNRSVEMEKTFEKETAVANFLRVHNVPNVLNTWKVKTEAGELGSLSQRCNCGTIRNMIPRLQSRKDRIQVCASILSVVRSWHKLNLCHLDLKTNNIMLDNFSKDRYHLILGDYGTAQQEFCIGLKGGKVPHYTSLVSTYPSPEMVAAHLKGRTIQVSKALDLWALADILFSVMTKQSLFDSYKLVWNQSLGDFDRKVDQMSRDLLNFAQKQKDPIFFAICRLVSKNPSARPSVDRLLPCFVDK